VRMEQFEAAVVGELEQRVMANGAAPNDNGKSQGKKETQPPLIITMDQIKAEKVDWLWANRVPIGRITLLDGDPGSGKSTLSLEIASAVSKGAALPFGERPRAPANVLLMSCEDAATLYVLDWIRPAPTYRELRFPIRAEGFRPRC